MISNGIKAIQKFEEFLDNSIEEDCFYECPKVFMYKIENPLCTDICTAQVTVVVSDRDD
jgi:hypothetical protein